MFQIINKLSTPQTLKLPKSPQRFTVQQFCKLFSMHYVRQTVQVHWFRITVLLVEVNSAEVQPPAQSPPQVYWQAAGRSLPSHLFSS